MIMRLMRCGTFLLIMIAGWMVTGGFENWVVGKGVAGSFGFC